MIISNSLIFKSIQQFWNEHVLNIQEDQHIIALFRIVSEEGTVSTIGYLKNVTNMKKNFINI